MIPWQVLFKPQAFFQDASNNPQTWPPLLVLVFVTFQNALNAYLLGFGNPQRFVNDVLFSVVLMSVLLIVMTVVAGPPARALELLGYSAMPVAAGVLLFATVAIEAYPVAILLMVLATIWSLYLVWVGARTMLGAARGSRVALALIVPSVLLLGAGLVGQRA